MRVANALLVAGIVIVIAGLSGASLAADESGRSDAQDVVATEEVGGGEATAPDDSEPAEPDRDEGGDASDEVATEPVTPTFDGGRGGDADDQVEEVGGGRDRGEKRRDRDKQPLADVSVDMVNISFKPKTVSIEPGDEVTWTNKDTAQHDAVGQGAANFDTGLLEKGESASVPLNDTGTFEYICTVHPTMKGTIKVGSSDSGGNGGKGGTSNTTDTSSGTGSSGSTFPSSGTGTGTDFSSGSGSSGGGGSLPNTGQAELPLLLLGSALIVLGLLGRAFHEYWIWR